MDSIIIKFNFIEIRWYSVLILLAFILGYFLVIKQAKEKNISISFINNICLDLIIICILGARVYYCIFNFDYYKYNLIDIIKIWEGGLAIHGGIIAGLIYTYLCAKKNKVDYLKLLDIFAPPLALGQAIGRWGNFFNQEAYGPIVSYVTLKKYNIPKFIIDGMFINNNYHHPTFLYESFGCLVIFIILLLLRKHKAIKNGKIISIYFILYGIIRFFIESLRQDSLMIFNIKIAQLISILMIISGIIILICKRGKYDK